MEHKEVIGYMTCEAHDLLVKDVERVKNDIGDLYSLDRQAQQDMAEIKQDIAEIKIDNKNIKTDLAEMKENQKEMRQDLQTVTTTINGINDNIQNLSKNKWQPKDYVAVITSALALAGVVVTAIYK